MAIALCCNAFSATSVDMPVSLSLKTQSVIGRDHVPPLRGLLVQRTAAGFHYDPSALRHGVADVDAEVQEGVLQLDGID